MIVSMHAFLLNSMHKLILQHTNFSLTFKLDMKFNYEISNISQKNKTIYIYIVRTFVSESRSQAFISIFCRLFDILWWPNCKKNVNSVIKQLSSNLKVPTFDIEIKRSRSTLLRTTVPTSSSNQKCLLFAIGLNTQQRD